MGREKELKDLKEALKKSYQSKGQVVEISGELEELEGSGFTSSQNIILYTKT